MKNKFPLQIRIENTNYCNARCIICPREKLTRPMGTMGFEFFKSLVNQAVQGRTQEVHLEGYGEPFLDDLICDKITYAKQSGIPHTLLVTNASLLSEKVSLTLLNSGLDKLKISFYGTNSREYEKVHQLLSYAEVKKNINLLLQLKHKLKKNRPVVVLKYIGPLWRFPMFLIQWGTKSTVSYARLHNYVNARQYNQPKTEKENRMCPMVSSPIMQVLWDGRVVPCCYDFNGKIILGDLNTQSIEQVWNSVQYQEFRSNHEKRDFQKLPFCYTCDKLQ